MPIEGGKPRDVFDAFRDHIADLFRATLPVPPSIQLRWHGQPDSVRAALEFVRRDDGVAACLLLRTTGYGSLYLAVRQSLLAELDGDKYILKTAGYSYRLLDEDYPTAKALIRWEYVGDRAAPHAYCRHHVQTRSKVPVQDVYLDFDRLHTPTGWVTIEEVIRFVIHDLGARRARDDWPKALERSEQQFYEIFTTKRYRPQGFEDLPGGAGDK